jgi:SPP1 family predicted phage head-tail adaptor
MQPGLLDQIITLQSATESNDGGQLLQSWSDVSPDVWGQVISLTKKGGEAFEAGKETAHDYVRIGIRYRADLTAKWRLQWLGQTYNITNVDRSERRKGMLWLTCEALNAQ